MTYKNWTQEEETLLKTLVSEGKYSYRQMETFFPGRSLNSLTSHARQYLNIYNDKYEQRKYYHDESFFDEPNVLNSYICGFLAADGCIRRPLTQGPTLSLEVSEIDVDHLNKIKECLGHTGVTKYRPVPHKKTVAFKLSCSEQYLNKLETNFGVIPRKSHHLSPPNLPSHDMKLAYLLGLLDGDGCVHICKTKKNLSISFTSSSLKAVEWYKNVMDSLNLPSIKNKPVNIHTASHAEAYTLCYAGARAVAFVKLIQAFYRTHNLPILRRKWDNPALNQYILDFEAKYPSFSYQPS